MRFMITPTNSNAPTNKNYNRRVLPGGVVLLSAWVVFASSFDAPVALASSPPKIMSLGPDLITVLTASPIRDKRTGVLEGVELQSEVTSETVAAANGWRSMRAVLDVSCPERRDRVRSMTVFEDHNGKGQAKALTPPGDWISPSQNTDYGLAAVKYFCGGGALATGASLPKPSSAQSPPAKSLVTTAPPSPHQIADNRVPEPAAPTSAQAMELDTTTNSVGNADQATLSAEKDVRRTPKASSAQTKTSASGSFAVQVGSTNTEADAKSILDHFKTAHADRFAGLHSQIESADVRGQRHYRALVVGFLDASSATRFCNALKPVNGCIVRRAP